MKILQLLGFGTLTLALGFSVACSDDDTSSSNTGGGGTSSSSSSGSGGSGGMGGSGPTCEGPGQTFDDIESMIGVIDGTVLDQNGNPADDILADVCGTNKCLSGETDTTGAFSTAGNGTMVTDVRLILGSGLRFAQMTSPIGDPTGFSFGTINTILLPAYADGAAIAAGSSSTSNMVTIDVDAEAVIKIDSILYANDAQKTFRATVFTPADGTFPAIPASANVQGLVATAPIDTKFCPGVKLTLPNTFGFMADDEVDVLYHGTNVLTTYAPYGGWAKVAEAQVSADGMTIALKEGESIEELGMFAFAPKQ